MIVLSSHSIIVPTYHIILTSYLIVLSAYRLIVSSYNNLIVLPYYHLSIPYNLIVSHHDVISSLRSIAHAIAYVLSHMLSGHRYRVKISRASITGKPINFRVLIDGKQCENGTHTRTLYKAQTTSSICTKTVLMQHQNTES